MKKIISFAIFLAFTLSSFAQMVENGQTLYGNEWINYNQTYYKFKLTTNGMHRINQTALQSAGIPVETVQAANFQIFYMGKQIPLYTTTEGVMTNSDYLEFFGKGNPFEMDKHLYANPATEHLNPNSTMFSDTSVYFLTWNNSTTNLRYNTIANDLSNLPAAETSYTNTTSFNMGANNAVSEELIFGPGINSQSSQFNAEGWGRKPDVNLTASVNLTIPNQYIVNTGGQAQVRVGIYSRDQAAHSLRIGVNGTEYDVDNFANAAYNIYNFDVPLSVLTATTSVFVKGMNGVTDKNYIAWAQITYPRSFNGNAGNAYSFILPSSNVKRYIEIPNFNHGGVAPVLYDRTNNYRIVSNLEGGIVKIALPVSASTNAIFIKAPNVFATTITNLSPVSFTNYGVGYADRNYLIVSHPKLFADGSGTNWVQEYANYRDASGYKSVILDINQLYDQFGYGVQFHPLAIRNFVYFAKANWAAPKYLFLLGKSSHFQNLRNPIGIQRCLVPTYGLPASDNLLAASNTSNVPILSVGRYAAYYPYQVRDYLKKVQEYEGLQTSLPSTEEARGYMKNVLHLGGGDPNIQGSIQQRLNELKGIIQQPKFGGRVFSFFKTSTDPIQISQSQLLDSVMNAGTSFISIFGHSSPNSFDFGFDTPETLTNYGKYPMMMSMGCYSGDIHDGVYGGGPVNGTNSERFVMAPDKGMIAFIATTNVGEESALYSYGKILYKMMGQTHYGKTIGDQMRETVDSLASVGGFTLVSQQMTLHGDPALKVNGFEAPDYVVKNNSITFNPSTIFTRDESFTVNCVVTNLGRQNIEGPQNLTVRLVRTAPNGSVLPAYEKVIPAPALEAAVSFTIPVFGDIALGENTFTITVDATNLFDERPNPAAENNNSATASAFILADFALPIYPSQYGIVPNSTVTLKAANANLFGAPTNFKIEIDTTTRFNSPIKRGTVIPNFTGGLIEWTPPITLTDSGVYYWRIRPDMSPADTIWKTSSFIYLNGEYPGWNQSHYFQYIANRFNTMYIHRDKRFDFIPNNLEIRVRNTYFGPNDLRPNVYQNGGSQIYSYQPCTYNYLNVGNITAMIIDPTTGVAQTNDATGGPDYGSVNCNNADVDGFTFPTTTRADRKKLLDFLNNPDLQNKYILLFSHRNYEPNEWALDSLDASFNGTNLFQALEARGATKIRQSVNGIGNYTFMFRNTQVIGEALTDSTNISVDKTYLLPGNWFKGSVESVVIGPATEWQSFHWKTKELTATDRVSVDIYGINNQQQRTLLVSKGQARDTVIAGINAQTYPYLQLQFNSFDQVNKTSAQLDYWRVLYKEIPEAVLRPEKFFVFNRDSVQRGEIVNTRIAVENVTPVNMDSLRIRYKVTKPDGTQLISVLKNKPLLAGDTLIAHFQIPTASFASYGNNSLANWFVEVNPIDSLHQNEKFHYNNIGGKNFYVQDDINDPVLDVTFDGIHILNGDLVSTKPTVIATLKDENQHLVLTDTTAFRVYLIYPDTIGNLQSLKQLYFAETAGDRKVNFYPATPSQAGQKNNRARIEFRPNFTTSGTYGLSIQAKDIASNNSGGDSEDSAYKIFFNVETAATVSDVLNYPNPFSTSTQFVFKLTGEELPTYMKIQIMTITGQVVREIEMDELGPLRMGINRTTFAWDGTDQFGDRLANGVYLYRVVTNAANGQSIELKNKETSTYFKSGFGKMYLMR